MAESFKTYLFRKEGNVWDVAIYIPKEKAHEFLAYKDKRVLCTVNGENTFHCALMPQGSGDFFINTNKELRKKAKLALGDEVYIQLEKDTSKYGMLLPKELETAWELDEEGHAIFHTLTMGKQRSLVYQIGKTKSSDTRIKKALTLLAYLKSVNGNLDYKELNEAYKLANKK
jgi:hypothetical protein